MNPISAEDSEEDAGRLVLRTLHPDRAMRLLEEPAWNGATRATGDPSGVHSHEDGGPTIQVPAAGALHPL